MRLYSRIKYSALPNAATQEAQESYLHPADKSWALYLKEVDKEDEHLVESWKGDTDGISIFTGLFTATVATFVTQTYQLLIPSSVDMNTAILMRVSQQIAGLSNNTLVAAYTPTPPVAPPFYAVWVNTLWFLSLFLSLTGALMATLMQQWTRRYLRGIRYCAVPHIRGPMHLALRLGAKKYKMKQAVTLITSILHASVFIFFAGLAGFAFSLNSIVANVLSAFISALVAVFIFLSILPMFSAVAPYDTVLTPALQTSYRLSRMLFAFAYGRVLEILPFLQHLGQDKERDARASVEDAEEHRFRSREQDLMHVVQRWDYFTTPHATYVLDKILTNADERHEIECFLDSMAIMWSDGSSRPLFLGDSQVMKNVFERHPLSSKIHSLIKSCDDSCSNKASLKTRIKRLHTVLAFILHDDIQDVAHLGADVAWQFSSDSFGWPLEMLAYDLDPSISFLSRLITICACMGAGVDGEVHHYKLRDPRTAAYGWYGEDTHTVARPLFCLVELVCTLLRYTTSDSTNDLLTAYYSLWVPILNNAQRHARNYLENNLRESKNLIIEPIPRALLIAAELGDLVYPFYPPPARRPPTNEEQLRIKYTFSTHPVLVYTLRNVAKTVSLIPFYGPSLRLAPALNHPMFPSDDFVLFGPLVWHGEAADAFRRLVYTWSDEHLAHPRRLTMRTSENPRGQGYVRISFGYRPDAQRFVDAWTASPLPAYQTVTANFWKFTYVYETGTWECSRRNISDGKEGVKA